MASQDTNAPDAAVEAGGAYELIRGRLERHSKTLGERTVSLNQRRLDEFGGTEWAVIDGARVRTENNCIPVDIVSVGDLLLFGYNVSTYLKETKVEDTFSLHRMEKGASAFEFKQQPLDGTFLADPKFRSDFAELYGYYKQTRLLLLRIVGDKLLLVFQTGQTIENLKVFRFRIASDGSITYVDSRGERDNTFPERYDFEWVQTTREMHVLGRHPHISIDDQVFVETVGGSLTIKIEDNTTDGRGIYSEPVDDQSQSLADANIRFAKVGTLILLRMLPYGEEQSRYLIFNTRTQRVDRIDAIGLSCVTLPDDHGLIFPGGLYLQNGQTKLFEGDFEGMRFKRMIRSPNGEDVLYLFHKIDEGRLVLLAYNMIRKELAAPLNCHGYSLYEDGTMVIFRADSDDATRVHQMQIWRTPFFSDEHAASQPTSASYLAKIGNPELVRGISDAFSITRSVDNQAPSRAGYEDLIAMTSRIGDHHHWLSNAEVGNLLELIYEIRATAELILDEFDKVQAVRQQAITVLAESVETQRDLLADVRRESYKGISQFVSGLDRLRKQRGHLITIKSMRYIDVATITELEAEIVDASGSVSQKTVQFLLNDGALEPYHKQITEVSGQVAAVGKVIEMEPLRESFAAISNGLDLLTEVVRGLQIDDATQRTQILERISEVLASLNREKATLEIRRKDLLSTEGVAEFGAQFKLFSQSVQGAIAVADTPEKCDDQLGQLLVQLEDLEARFSEFDEFLDDLAKKREEVYEAFEAKKQQLTEERQRRAQNLARAAERILQGVKRRAAALKSADELNAYFAADAMIQKLRQLVAGLRQLDEAVRADDIEAKLKSARDQAIRALRDKLDIYDDGGAVIRLGRHRFSVNTQPLSLTILPRDDQLVVHLGGTDYFEVISDAALNQAADYWQQSLVSETDQVYRSEYLAASIFLAAEAEQDGLTLDGLHQAQREPDGLLAIVRKQTASRYDEGYERGVHDVDAVVILDKLLQLQSTAGRLAFSPRARSLGQLFWCFFPDAPQKKLWERKGRNFALLAETFAESGGLTRLSTEFQVALTTFVESNALVWNQAEIAAAAAYLVVELRAEHAQFVVQQDAMNLADGLISYLDQRQQRQMFERDLAALAGDVVQQFEMATSWLAGFAKSQQLNERIVDEAAAFLLTRQQLTHDVSAASTILTASGLLGQHRRIDKQQISESYDEFLARLRRFTTERVPGFRDYRRLRQQVVERERETLRLDEFKPKVMTSFVRNRLINEVYLPIIGANLAKQMGTVGADKRTDLMGMLLLISPPGYGKTTLMEYVADRLGLVFLKVNCPAIGHAVTSLDPAEAPNATAKSELIKLNLGFEMGNNVMIYLDDIQHTDPELLQKFISLCDGQRKIEGVWKGRTKTYDLRGKKICVVMAGNPYTESGDVFKVPDMLANRADIYNLGDMLSGKEEAFSLSYIENCLTSNSALAPLATGEMSDVYALIKMAQGQTIPTTELKADFTSGQVDEIVNVLKKLLVIQDVVLKVNQQYIASASQAAAYRTEPPFKLQGSYRNMNKMGEKVVAVMNDEELAALIADHYRGEAQTLTTGAEENLLKLHELVGVLTDDETVRWGQLKAAFQRQLRIGGGDADTATRVVGQLDNLGEQLGQIDAAIRTVAQQVLGADTNENQMAPYLERLQQAISQIAETKLEMKIVNTPPPGIDTVLQQLATIVESTLIPLVHTIDHKLKSDKAIWERLGEVTEVVKSLDLKAFGSPEQRRHTLKPFSASATSITVETPTPESSE